VIESEFGVVPVLLDIRELKAKFSQQIAQYGSHFHLGKVLADAIPRWVREWAEAFRVRVVGS